MNFFKRKIAEAVEPGIDNGPSAQWILYDGEYMLQETLSGGEAIRFVLFRSIEAAELYRVKHSIPMRFIPTKLKKVLLCVE